MTGFFELPRSERRDILTTLAPGLGYRPEALEKDVGICWVLEKLSTIEQINRRTALKGGTSLSKAYNLIDRFSEDIDLTVDYHSFLDGEAPDLLTLGRNATDRLSKRLMKGLQELLLDFVVPQLERVLPELSDEAEIEFRPTDELIILKHPSVLESRGTYLKEEILLEFGARNVINPSSTMVIEPLIGPGLTGLRMPTASVLVLAAERTFWEKATLVHVACTRGFKSRSAERQSRHWYDLAILSRSEAGTSAMSDRALLTDVIRVKTAFFNSSSARYTDCLSGRLRLVPDDQDRSRLQNDYEAMMASGLFRSAPPSFSELMEEISGLQESINGSVRDEPDET